MHYIIYRLYIYSIFILYTVLNVYCIVYCIGLDMLIHNEILLSIRFTLEIINYESSLMNII